MKKDFNEKNKVIFGVIIDKDLKDVFIRKATLNEETASKLVRKFIKKYVGGK